MSLKANCAIVAMLATATDKLTTDTQLVGSMLQATMAGVSRRLLESAPSESAILPSSRWGLFSGWSGIALVAAHALLELYEVTEILKYRDAALSAFEYEQHWFNFEIANWPDFRKNPSSPSEKNIFIRM